MAQPAESTRLLGYTAASTTTPNTMGSTGATDIGAIEHGVRSEHYRNPKHVDINNMKRNMSIAKGFMDVSLLIANASQLKHVLLVGTESFTTTAYHLILFGISLSLILQVVTGIMLIVKERFDINIEDHQHSANLYNNITIALIFATLLINVFISSFGVGTKVKVPYNPYDQNIKGQQSTVS
ncbi:Ninjurin-2 [Armadillidium nasatum]|uniref:Ninjurin-2 n=1 Tax=Armadillidium nasatum TaxID=96803 RepID=A0A5N5TNV5_9CRUS|nr:Ninjurin-2 [Armadillidium nasatum]KAB7507812.1 Ninjurin-2 [Armadillidium nasatum]